MARETNEKGVELFGCLEARRMTGFRVVAVRRWFLTADEGRHSNEKPLPEPMILMTSQLDRP